MVYLTVAETWELVTAPRWARCWLALSQMAGESRKTRSLATTKTPEAAVAAWPMEGWMGERGRGDFGRQLGR
jgi:hypothetical protein